MVGGVERGREEGDRWKEEIKRKGMKEWREGRRKGIREKQNRKRECEIKEKRKFGKENACFYKK